MQQLALLYLMHSEQKDRNELENQRFKMNLVASHPDKAKQLLEALDGYEEAEEQVEPVVTEEAYEPDEKGYMLDELRRLGFIVKDG